MPSTSMKIVADHLVAESASRSIEAESDLFGRSAFNRFYYASYLETRTLLGELDASWARTPHKNIPPLLKDTVQTAVKAELRKQNGKLISPHEAKTMAKELNVAINDLASLLTVAYLIRCVADYEPTIKTKKNGSTLELQNHTLHEASGWPQRAAAHTKTIRKIWRTLAIT